MREAPRCYVCGASVHDDCQTHRYWECPRPNRVDPTACPECVGSGVDLDGGKGDPCPKCGGTGDRIIPAAAGAEG